MTTAFVLPSPSSKCANLYFGSTLGASGPALLRGGACRTGTLSVDPECPDATPFVTGRTACPTGYRSVWNEASAGYTTDACCPSGYTQYLTKELCITVTNTNVASAYYCTNSTTTGPLTKTALTIQFGNNDVTAIAIFARPIYITSSIPSTSSSTFSSQSTATASSSRTSVRSVSPQTTTSSVPPVNTDSGMSKGAIAGTVIGVLLAFAALIALMLWLLRRRKRKVAASPNATQPVLHAPPSESFFQQNHEMDASNGPPMAFAPPHYGPPMAFAPPHHGPPSELPTTTGASTLPSRTSLDTWEVQSATPQTYSSPASYPIDTHAAPLSSPPLLSQYAGAKAPMYPETGISQLTPEQTRRSGWRS